MYQILLPKFRFGLFVIDSSKNHFYKQNNNNHLPIICHADTYEIKEDGSIVFFQTIRTEDEKKFKVPVLSYPNGKWDACVLLDDANDFPVFKGHSFVQNHVEPSKSVEENFSHLQESVIDDELTQLSDNFANSIEDKNYHSSHVSTQQQHQTMSFHHGETTGNGMPGISNQNNPQEFKKQKDEWLENEIKQYVKEEDIFVIKSFLSSISKKQQNKIFKSSESDVVWASSKLIRNKAVVGRKFSEPNIQKVLFLILPDIMKRQWDGKMAPILQILQEREETKNITAIDLSVWMVQNNY